MVIVDTSIWVSHLRNGNAELVNLLNDNQVMCHPFIVGEIACGNIRNRAEILALLRSLPMSIQAKNEEVLEFIESNKLMGHGLGYVDMHLSASAALSGVPIWTLDAILDKTNRKMGTGYRS
jgi:predicted nucleic acid-binding protein